MLSSPRSHLLPTLVLALLVGGSTYAQPRLQPIAELVSDGLGAVVTESFGMPNLVATLGRYPALASAVLPYSTYLLNESSLPVRDRELLWLRTAWLARSSYVWAHRAARARAVGLGEGDLARIAAGPDADGWSPFDAALLRAADELHVDAFLTDETWRTLQERYDERQLIDLLYGVGEIEMLADFANTLRIEIEAGVGDRFPPGVARVPRATPGRARLLGQRPRIAPLERESWSAEVQQLLDPTGAGRPVPNVFRTFARHPASDALRNAVGAHIRDATSLTPQHRQTLIMRTAVLCRSEYEWAVHSRVGRQVGLDDAAVAAVIAGPHGPAGGTLEAALLRAADDLHRDNEISDETWTALAALLDERQLLDVIVTVGGYRSAAYAINSSGVQLDRGMEEHRLPEHLR